FLDTVDAGLDHLAARHPWAHGVGFPAGITDQQVLVHQGPTEVGHFDRPGNALNAEVHAEAISYQPSAFNSSRPHEPTPPSWRRRPLASALDPSRETRYRCLRSRSTAAANTMRILPT